MLLLPSFATHPEFASSTRENLINLSRNQDVVSSLVVSVMKWRSLVEDVVSRYEADVSAFFAQPPSASLAGCSVREKLLLDEIALWQQQVSTLALSGQMRSETVQLLLDILHASNNEEGLAELKLLQTSSERLHICHKEATDAFTHLFHLRPYIEHLTKVCACELPLSEAVDTLSPLFSALRMVWNCSSMYGGETEAGTTRFWGLMTRVVVLVARSVREHILKIPPKIGIDMVSVVETTVKPTSSRAHILQKQVVLDALEITTSTKEAYYKIRVYLEEATAAYRWNFDDTDEELIFTDVDYMYERGLELLSCLDLTASHYATHLELKRKKREDGHVHCNTALLSATLNDINAVLNEIDFDFTNPATSAEWQAIFADIRHKSTSLKKLELGAPDDESPDQQDPQTQHQSTSDVTGPIVPSTDFVAKPPSDTLLLVLSFNPPEVSVSGPVKETTMDHLTSILPQAFTTATSKALFGKVTPPCFVQRAVGDEGWGALGGGKGGGFGVGKTYWHLRADAQFCDDLSQAYICVLILDALETEGRWILRDTNATYLQQSQEKADGSKVYYKYFFTHRREEEKTRSEKG